MKKILSVILALMMFVLPISSLAESQTLEVYAKHGSLTELLTLMGLLPAAETDEEATATDSYAESAVAEAINDLIDSVSGNFYVQKDALQAGGALCLGGNQIVTADVALDGAAVKIASNLLGSDVAVIDLSDIVSRVFSQADFSGLGQMVQLFTTFASVDFSDFSLENTTTMLNDLAARLNDGITAVTEQPAGCDPASAKVSFTVSSADLVNFFTALADDMLNCASLRSLVASTLGEDTDVEAMRDQLVAAMNEKYSELGELAIEFYVDEDGGLVAGTASNQNVTMTMTRNTADGVVDYELVETVDGESLALSFAYSSSSVALQVAVPEQGFSMGGTYAAAENEHELLLYIGYDTIGIMLDANSVESENDKTLTVDLYCTGAVADYLSNPVLLTIKAVSSTAEDVAAISGNEVNLSSMSEEKLQNWTADVSFTALFTLIPIAQSLPDSVISLFLGQ